MADTSEEWCQNLLTEKGGVRIDRWITDTEKVCQSREGVSLTQASGVRE